MGEAEGAEGVEGAEAAGARRKAVFISELSDQIRRDWRAPMGR